MTQFSAGIYTYCLIEDFPKLPAGVSFGKIYALATDSRDRLYVFQCKNPPVLVFDREGNYLDSWGNGTFARPHGLNIVDDVVYATDRDDSAAVIFTLEGRPLQVNGQPGKTDPGHFHLPHNILLSPDEKLYVTDRGNNRVQIFSPEGEFISMWTGMNGPNGIARDNDGMFYISEHQERKAPGMPGFVSIRDAAGTLLARWEGRSGHGLSVDSRGDIYLGLAAGRAVDKYVRQ